MQDAEIHLSNSLRDRDLQGPILSPIESILAHFGQFYGLMIGVGRSD